MCPIQETKMGKNMLTKHKVLQQPHYKYYRLMISMSVIS